MKASSWPGGGRLCGTDLRSKRIIRRDWESNFVPGCDVVGQQQRHEHSGTTCERAAKGSLLSGDADDAFTANLKRPNSGSGDHNRRGHYRAAAGSRKAFT